MSDRALTSSRGVAIPDNKSSLSNAHNRCRVDDGLEVARLGGGGEGIGDGGKAGLQFRNEASAASRA